MFVYHSVCFREWQPEARLAIKTREGQQVVKLPSGTKLLIIHNSDAEAEPHHVDIGEVTVMGPVKDFLKWSAMHMHTRVHVQPSYTCHLYIFTDLQMINFCSNKKEKKKKKTHSKKKSNE